MKLLFVILAMLFSSATAVAQTEYLTWSTPTRVADNSTGLTCTTIATHGLRFAFLEGRQLLVAFENVEQSIIGTQRKLKNLDTRAVSFDFFKRRKRIGRLNGEVSVHRASTVNGKPVYDFYIGSSQEQHIDLFRSASYVILRFRNGGERYYVLDGSAKAISDVESCNRSTQWDANNKSKKWKMTRSNIDWQGDDESGEGAPIAVCSLENPKISFSFYARHTSYYSGGEVRLTGDFINDDKDHTIFIDNRYKKYFSAETFPEEGYANVTKYEEEFFRNMARGHKLNLVHGNGSNPIDIQGASQAVLDFINCAKEKTEELRTLANDWKVEGSLKHKESFFCYAVHKNGFRVEKYKHWPSIAKATGNNFAISNLLLLPIKQGHYIQLAQTPPKNDYYRQDFEQADLDFDVDLNVGIRTQLMDDRSWKAFWLDAKKNNHREGHTYVALKVTQKIINLISKNDKLTVRGETRRGKSLINLSPEITQLAETDNKLFNCVAGAEKTELIAKSDVKEDQKNSIDILIDQYFALIASGTQKPDDISERCNLSSLFLNGYPDLVKGDMEDLITAQRENDECVL